VRARTFAEEASVLGFLRRPQPTIVIPVEGEAKTHRPRFDRSGCENSAPIISGKCVRTESGHLDAAVACADGNRERQSLAYVENAEAMSNWTQTSFVSGVVLNFHRASSFGSASSLASPFRQTLPRKRALRNVALNFSMSATNSTSPPQAPTKLDVPKFFDTLKVAQRSMCETLEGLDGGCQVFCADSWSREDGSHGLTRVLQGGNVLEKAGVNVSFVQGILTKERAMAMRSRGRECDAGSVYEAAALSFVLHFQSPFLPTLRGDVRVFAIGDEAWGGGGVDLTPFYVDIPLFTGFHKFWRDICDDFDETYYKKFSKACDDYFYIPFRGGRNAANATLIFVACVCVLSSDISLCPLFSTLYLHAS
jgi:hypothetical protein